MPLYTPEYIDRHGMPDRELNPPEEIEEENYYACDCDGENYYEILKEKWDFQDCEASEELSEDEGFLDEEMTLNEYRDC